MFSLCFARLRKNYYYYQFSQNCQKGGWEGWVHFMGGISLVGGDMTI